MSPISLSFTDLACEFLVLSKSLGHSRAVHKWAELKISNLFLVSNMGPSKYGDVLGPSIFWGALGPFFGGPCMCHFRQFFILQLCPALTCLNQKNHHPGLPILGMGPLPQNRRSPPEPNWPVLKLFRCFVAFLVLLLHCGFALNKNCFCGPPLSIGGPDSGFCTWGTPNMDIGGPNSPCSTFWAAHS